MVTADQTGYVKYWQSNMNNVKMFQAHKEPVRAIRWAFIHDFWRTAGDVSIDQIISISISIAIKKQILKLFLCIAKIKFLYLVFLPIFIN